jgi:hypothetical protein
MQLPMKLMDYNVKKIYNPAQRSLYEPFRSKDITKIILHRIKRIVGLNSYQEKGII